MGPYDLSSTQLAELLRIMDVYHDEAERCLSSGAHLAACVMLAAELEAVLLATASVNAEEVDESPKRPEQKGKPKPLIDWNLWESLRLARDLHWLPSDWSIDVDVDGRLIRADDHADLLRKVRNLIHPARYIQDFLGGHVTEAELHTCYRVVEDVIDHLGRMLGPATRPSEVH